MSTEKILNELLAAAMRYQMLMGHAPTHVHVSVSLYLMLPEIEKISALVQRDERQSFSVAGSEAVADHDDLPNTGYHFRFLDHEEIKAT